MKNKTFFISIIFALTIFYLLSAKDSETAGQFEKVDKVVENAVADSAFPGAVVLVAKDDAVLYEKAFGRFTYDENSTPVEWNTIYDLASVSKIISTTTCAMICFDRNLFALDDKVSKYIPEFGVNGKENITITNLLVHNSGLRPDVVSYRIYKDSPDPEQDILNEIYNDTLIYPTGTKMVYSDLGMITMAKIIEKVTGRTLDEFAEDEIFSKLGMNNTMYNPPASIKYRIAPTETDDYFRFRQLQGEVHDETAFLMGGVAGHAGLFSTAEDIAKLLQMLLQNGRFSGIQLIEPETVELFIKKQSDLSSRALGWDTKSPEGYSSAGSLFDSASYGHTGYTGTSVWTDPTRNLFVVFLTNRVYPTRKNNKLRWVRPKLHDAVIESIEE